MSKSDKMKTVQAINSPERYSWDCTSNALGKWAEISAAESDDAATISIYDAIGENWDGTGWTPKRMAGVLRSIGPKDVTVNINSPGGNVFDGLAIYNLLIEHPAKVTVKVMGIAASAASIIAMAADELQMGDGSFLMIHNAWSVTIGDKQDHTKSADVLASIDKSMNGIYAARSGVAEKKLTSMMDDETYLNAQEAVDLGLADTVVTVERDIAKASAPTSVEAKKRIEAILAKDGVPRSERRRLLKEAAGKQDAASQNDATQDAGTIATALNKLLQTISN